MKVSLIIPIYNESLHLKEFLDIIDQVDLGCEKELVIIDDCSTDGSDRIVAEHRFQSSYQFLKQTQNQGKGAAIRAGIAAAQGEIIGIQDADFEYQSSDLPAVLKPLLEGKADVVYGSRFKKSALQVHRTYHYLINRFLTTLSNLLSGLYLTDMETCYKFFRADIIKNINLESNRFGFEPEVTARIARLKIRVVEVPVSYFPRNYLEGKKITWKDGIAAVRHIIYFNLKHVQKRSYTPLLPKHYIPVGQHWL